MFKFGRRRGPDEEIEEYRSLMEPPAQFEEGFTTKTILGVLFVAFIMVPGNIYLSLMIGGSLGAAAEWVTIILFAEVAKRSFTTLRRQETYLLYYVAASLIAAETGAFEGLLWNQYLVQSPAARQFGIAHLIPSWVAPQPDSPAVVGRTFLHPDWVVPILLLIAGTIISRVSWFCVGYCLFRLTSDVERLPFPFAPIAAQGATALAETTSGEETWRWKVFSGGAMIGLAFGTVYVGVPAVSGTLAPQPIQLIPIPFVDLTQITGNFLPATPTGFTAHLGPVFTGMVIPFWAVVGTFSGVVIYTVANPILYRMGYLTHWHQGMGTIDTVFVNSVDFWMSFGIGTSLAIAAVGIYQVVAHVKGIRASSAERRASRRPPPGRGDFPIWVALSLAMGAMGCLILIAWILLPNFSRFVWWFLFFGFVYTPIFSFVNARLWGLVGQTVAVPYVREATILLSGYRGLDIWFVPFPLQNYGTTAGKFREIELTGTKFTSVIKAEVLMVPIVLVASFLYWSYIWKLAPIPSSTYPYAQEFWRLRAYQDCLWYTGTFRGEIRGGVWTPANLPDGMEWHWRACGVDREGRRGPWTEVRTFVTQFGDTKRETSGRPGSERQALETSESEAPVNPSLPTPKPVSPSPGEVVRTPTPALAVEEVGGAGDTPEYYFELDADPTFSSPWKQTSRDEPWLYKAIKPTIIGLGFVFGTLSFIVLTLFGLPILLVFGYVRSLTTIPHFLIPEMAGALLARYYFWKKYGRRQWRLYAPVLAVGFAAGMALISMAAVAVALIQKSVSVLIY